MELSRGSEVVYWFFALVGSSFFLFRLAAMTWAGWGGDGAALDHGADAPGGVSGEAADGHDHAVSGTDTAFKLVSLQSLTGFFMTFGWAGLACQKQFGLGTTSAFFISSLAGGAAMFLTAYLFKAMARLNSAGDVFAIEKTVGLTGSVYLRVPAEGRGQVRLAVNNGTRFVDAISEDRIELDSFVPIVVVRSVDNATVSVRKLK